MNRSMKLCLFGLFSLVVLNSIATCNKKTQAAKDKDPTIAELLKPFVIPLGSLVKITSATVTSTFQQYSDGGWSVADGRQSCKNK